MSRLTSCPPFSIHGAEIALDHGSTDLGLFNYGSAKDIWTPHVVDQPILKLFQNFVHPRVMKPGPISTAWSLAQYLTRVMEPGPIST